MKKRRPLKFKTPKELEEKINAYFDFCDNKIIKRIINKNGDLISEVATPYTITGLASFLGTNRQTLVNYEKKSDDFFDAIKKAKALIESNYEERALIGDNNVVMTIFALKNNFNWRDKQETDITSGGKPIPLLGNVRNNKSIKEDSSFKKEN